MEHKRKRAGFRPVHPPQELVRDYRDVAQVSSARLMDRAARVTLARVAALAGAIEIAPEPLPRRTSAPPVTTPQEAARLAQVERWRSVGERMKRRGLLRVRRGDDADLVDTLARH